MGNRISHTRVVIDFDVWEPWKNEAEKDMDKLVEKIKSKELLTNCGNVHFSYEERDKEIKNG